MQKEKKIRVHNKSGKEFVICPAPGKKKNRTLFPGRAVEIEETTAKKLMKSYPLDLIEFDSLVSGEKKDLSKENARLETENEELKRKLAEMEKSESKSKSKTKKKD